MNIDPERKRILEESALNMLAKANFDRKPELKLETVDLSILEQIPEDPRKTRIVLN